MRSAVVLQDKPRRRGACIDRVRNSCSAYRINKTPVFAGEAQTLGGSSAAPAADDATAAREARAKAAETRLAAAAAANL